MALSREELRQLAIEGAKARLQALDTERRSLLQEFPELSGARGSGRRAQAQRSGRRARSFTAAQRREISRRMKALWAERRKKKGKPA